MAELEELHTLEGHTDRVWAVAWSPSGNCIASCSGDKTVRIWTRQPAVSPLAAAPSAGDGGAASGAGPVDDSGVRWHCTAVLEETHHRTIRSVAWSPDGSHLATASFDACTAVWRVQGGTWEHVSLLEGHENEVKSVAWSPNGMYLATCGRDKTVWIWEFVPGAEFECVDVKQGHTQDVKMVAWHPCSEVLASCSYDNSIKLWRDGVDEWECAQTVDGTGGLGHDGTVWALAFDPKGERLASCSDDLTVRIWSCSGMPGEPRLSPEASISGHHSRSVYSVSWSPDGLLLATGSGDNAIRVFRRSDSSPDKTVQDTMEGTPALDSPQDGSTDPTGGAMATYELAASKEGSHPLDVNCVAWCPSDASVLASAGDDGAVRLWRLPWPAGGA